MNYDETKYCKFCNKERPMNEFCKSGGAVKNICRECQNKKQKQIYNDSKKTKQLQQENQHLKAILERINNYLDKNYTIENQFWFDYIRDIVNER